jgi:F0F1-type ATP synthase assembly protein I
MTMKKGFDIIGSVVAGMVFGILLIQYIPNEPIKTVVPSFSHLKRI